MRIDSMLSTGLLKSGLRRFWPLWLAGLAALFLAVDLPVYTTATQLTRLVDDPASQASLLEGLWALMGFLGWLYAFVGAIVVALALNEHLFDARSATFVGSLPARRGPVFGSTLVAGVVVLVGLPLVTALLMAPLRAALGTVFPLGGVVRWLVVTASLACVFYAFALLACQLSGARAVALLLYLVMSLLPVCLEWAANLVVSSLVYGMASLMYGMGAGHLLLDRLSPGVWLAEAATGWSPWGLSRWAMIAPYLLVGLAVVAAARGLYVRRDLETAGESVSYAQVRPVLKYLAGISTSLLFGSVYRLLVFLDGADGLPLRSGEVAVLAPMLMAGAFLGVLFAEMIMSRSAHVLERVWRGGLVLGCLALACVGACRLDVLGVARRVPEASEVERVALACDTNAEDMTISSPEGVAAVCELQRDLIAYGGAGDRSLPCFTVHVAYELKGGRKMVRAYPVLSDYFAYRTGERRADQGAALIDRFAEIANTEEGRASRFAPLYEGDASDLMVQLEYALPDGTSTTLDLSAAERKDLVSHALRDDLMHELAGDVFVDVGGVVDEDGYDASVSVLKPVGETDDAYQVLVNVWLAEAKTPNVIAWVREHHPEVELLAWK